MFVRYRIYAALLINLVQIHTTFGMKMTLATKLQCPDVATYQLVEAIKEDTALAVKDALIGVDPTILITVSELYDLIEPKERTFKLSLLQLAVSFLAKKSVELLLTHPIEVDFVDASVNGCLNHGTALMVLCRTVQVKDQEKGHAILRMLLEKGANPNVRDIIGTPLSYRARAGDLVGVQLLLSAKADPHVIVYGRRFGSGHIEKHFLLRALVHDIEDRIQKEEDQEGIAQLMTVVQSLLDAGAISYLHRLAVIGGASFEEDSALTVVKNSIAKLYSKRHRQDILCMLYLVIHGLTK